MPQGVSVWGDQPHPGLRCGTSLVPSKLGWIKPGGRREGKDKAMLSLPQLGSLSWGTHQGLCSTFCAVPGHRTDPQVLRDTFPHRFIS